ncbi:MAG: MBL fold metallo-hydrolase [Tannerellaceae bacterium]|jgi:L-ascorbate metabolism protein UlaG (beta-lactamase superfamily)|nr:MBL fold metallo-hydrolase [Tannerellaceae bacterium]
MRLTYIYHSCYVVETEDLAIIFDYYKDSGKSPAGGYVHDELLRRKKKLYVFASHFHPDHFNPDILNWKQGKDNIVYILSADILEHKKATEESGLFLNKGGGYTDEYIRVKAFGSTDVGVSFLVEVDGKLLFHAGDLNNWHWMDESTKEEVEEAEKAYLDELELLANATGRLDVAMFPIDPRLGTDYMRGAKQFVARIRTSLFAPMHFGEAYNKVAAFREYAELHHCKLLALTGKGQQIEL